MIRCTTPLRKASLRTGAIRSRAVPAIQEPFLSVRVLRHQVHMAAPGLQTAHVWIFQIMEARSMCKVGGAKLPQLGMATFNRATQTACTLTNSAERLAHRRLLPVSWD